MYILRRGLQDGVQWLAENFTCGRQVLAYFSAIELRKLHLPSMLGVKIVNTTHHLVEQAIKVIVVDFHIDVNLENMTISG